MVWIAELIISRPTANKITARHRLDPEDVYRELVGVSGLSGRVVSDAERGERVLIDFSVGGDRCIAVLYDTHHPLGGVWRLASAYRT